MPITLGNYILTVQTPVTCTCVQTIYIQLTFQKPFHHIWEAQNMHNNQNLETRLFIITIPSCVVHVDEKISALALVIL
jgi:hypothetical protein